MIASAKLSPALAYLTAAVAALPKTLGDRERVEILDRLYMVAIDARMSFDLEDGEQLKRHPYQIRTCVGVFDALRETWYYRACAAGGTFARMWEKHHGFKPWMAPKVYTGKHDDSPLKNNRMAPGMGMVLSAWTGDDGMLQSTKDGQVWWCTSMTNDKLVLCRYASGPAFQPYRPEGMKPSKRRTISRAEWELMTGLASPAAQAA